MMPCALSRLQILVPSPSGSWILILMLLKRRKQSPIVLQDTTEVSQLRNYAEFTEKREIRGDVLRVTCYG